MAVVSNYETPTNKPSQYYRAYAEIIAHYAVQHGMLLGGKSVSPDAPRVLKQPAPFIIPQYPEVATALWNDETSLPNQNIDVNAFRKNYENAIGGVRGIPVSLVNYVDLAPKREVQSIVATHENGDCPNLSGSGLCYPQLTETINWLLTKLAPLP